MATYEIIICQQCECRQKVPARFLGKIFVCVECGAKIETEELPTALEAEEESAVFSDDAGDSPALSKQLLGEMLIDEGFIDELQLAEALRFQKVQGGKLAEALIALHFLTMRTFINFLAKQPGVASIDLASYQIPEELPALVPREVALKHEIIPVDRLGRTLTVAMACPLDTRAIDELEEITGLKVQALLCSPENLRLALKKYYPSD